MCVTLSPTYVRAPPPPPSDPLPDHLVGRALSSIRRHPGLRSTLVPTCLAHSPHTTSETPSGTKAVFPRSDALKTLASRLKCLVGRHPADLHSPRTPTGVGGWEASHKPRLGQGSLAFAPGLGATGGLPPPAPAGKAAALPAAAGAGPSGALPSSPRSCITSAWVGVRVGVGVGVRVWVEVSVRVRVSVEVRVRVRVRVWVRVRVRVRVAPP